MKKMKKKHNRFDISSQKDNEVVTLISYEVTDERMLDKTVKKLPSRVRKQIEELYGLLSSDPEKAIPPLIELIKKYPDVPVFSNYLIAAYRMSGQQEKANAIILESYKKHPDYLFAKINYALYWIQKGHPHKVPEIFDHKLELQMLYPDRIKFHITEFLNFNGLMALYYSAIGEREIAIRYYQIIKKIDPTYDIVQVVKNALYPSLTVRLLRKLLRHPAKNAK
jgi:tetratricopeptide (TPR) repeat protein